MKPLDGLRVIDLTQAMAAPYCTMNLADLGADVIKVEPPGGEEQRRGATSRHGHSGSFMAINRNKRGITLDLKTPEGVEVMHRLIRTADVFVQNYRPGAAGRLGVDYDTLRALNPRLIYCSVSGVGSTGPYAAHRATGRPPRALGSAHRLSAPYHALRASDGWFTVGAANDKLFDGFCRALGRPDLLDDPRFAGRAQRLEHRHALAAEIDKTTAKETRAHWLERLDSAGVPCGPINTYPEALDDPHTLARGMVVDLVHPGAGAIKALGVPVHLSETPGAVDRPAPLIGQHNDECLSAPGYDAAARQRLRDAGVV